MKKAMILLLSLMLTFVFVACNSSDTDQPKPQPNNEISEKEENIQPVEVEEVTPEETDQSEESTEEPTEEPTEETKEEVVLEPEPINYEEVQPNEIGSIMVVMYHGIMDNPPYHRTAEDFKKDLSYMYENGYRPISIEDYINNNITVQAGLTPIVLAFDDGLSSSFSLTKGDDGTLVPKEGTAVYMMEEFYKEHPDFGKAATFFINGDDAFGEGDGTYRERLQWLVDNDYSLGNHTATHAHLNTLSADELQKEMAIVDEMISNAVPGYEVRSLAYPFGERPLNAIDLVEEGTYNDYTYTNEIAFRVGYSAPYVGPNHINYQPFNHPRVTASEGYDWDLWYAFNYYEQSPNQRYRSDGNPNTIAVPSNQEKNVNMDSLGEKELIVY
ncbi:polysaccharide deacetylase family protein [Vallitalea okinawensis]|uniref:polysaccharide deacetylase family protein n=1 Tax=Vallitalea okinawensis TaxID=2078660 RepID=UPI000CFD2B5C|nr:polysaccharide deacetylase family protein [Vallitalea okinawensis]